MRAGPKVGDSGGGIPFATDNTPAADRKASTQAKSHVPWSTDDDTTAPYSYTLSTYGALKLTRVDQQRAANSMRRRRPSCGDFHTNERDGSDLLLFKVM